MSVYRDYYRGQEEKMKRQFEKPKPIRKYCWKLEIYVEILDGKCQRRSCPYRGSVGCLEVELAV